MKSEYFKIYKGNLWADCPFFDIPMRCGLSQCTILEEDDIRNSTHFKAYMVNTNLTEEDKIFTQYISIEEYSQTPHELDWMGDAHKDSEATYVDLTKNSERHSGYNGSNIWYEIYTHNLAKMKFPTPGLHEKFLYRLVSGVQANINMHISRFYMGDQEGEYGSNRKLFYERIGRFPERVENLYYTYVFLLDVLEKISTFLPKYTYDPKNFKADRAIQNKLIWLGHYVKSLPNPTLIERSLFADASKANLRDVMKASFKNMTQLLD